MFFKLSVNHSKLLKSKDIQQYFEGLKKLKIITYEKIDSTNTEAKRILDKKCINNAMLIADKQTTGRGRLGRSFYSPLGTGIYMTIIYNLKSAPDENVLFTAKTAVAVALAVEKVTGNKPEIKWVNDLYISGKKVCGILTELHTDKKNKMQHLIIGIGINVYTSDFPEEINATATSLGENESIKPKLIAQITENVFKLLGEKYDSFCLNEYRKNCFILGKEIEYIKNGTKYYATAKDIDDSYGLIAVSHDGTIDTLRSGEISIRIKKEEAF
ncbi:MAG: biotin--[acetyl-CoA-carboxylase] ligase [Bacillota bacterium]|nr:biotin--[acetyl-CoA-carboxylase] ligase [Bacillota bacterium]